MRIDTSDKALKQIFGAFAVVLAFFVGASGASAHVSGAPAGAEIFYTAFATIVFSFFLINFALKNRVGVYYSLLFALMLAVVWSLEGGLSAIAPDLSACKEQSISITIGLLGAGVGFFTAEQAIDQRNEMKAVRTVMRGLSVFSLLVIMPAWVWPNSSVLVLAVNLLLIAMFASHIVSTMTWRTLSDKPNRFPLIITVILLLASVGLFWLFIGSNNGGAFNKVLLFRLAYALVASPTMAAIVLALIDIRRSRDTALEAALAAAQKDAKMSSALLEMEKNYSRARDVAANRTRQISTVSHDIRQPIASMRAELDVMKRDLAPENVERLDRILNHFSDLTEDLSRSAASTGEDPVEGEREKIEEVPAQLFFTMLARMFKTEAATKNTDLRFVDSSSSFSAPAVPLMRIASNLVSNAINHSQATKIIVGVQKRGEHLRLLVADNGAGLPDEGEGTRSLFKSGVKGADSTGSGLGLSIVQELSDRHGFTVSVVSKKGAGSAFSVLVPIAR